MSFYSPNFNSSTNLALTEDQSIAKQKLQDFLKTSNQKNVFVLQGFAGTGKTTLVNHVIKDSFTCGKKICVTAFTNQATGVIREKTPYATATTLFKLLGLKADETSEVLTFNNEFKETNIRHFNIIILDEVSMVNDEHLTFLIDEVNRSWGCKLIIMGDRCQLPPVNQDSDSIAFNHPNGYELTKIIRQGNNSNIPQQSFYIRNIIKAINNGQKIPIKVELPFDKEFDDDVRIIKNSPQFVELLLNDFNSDEYKKNTDFVKVLAYRNATVDKTNDIIRKSIFKGQENEAILLGESLITNSPSFDIDELKTGGTTNIYDTSDEIEIVNIEDKQLYERTHNGVLLTFPYCVAQVKRKYDKREARLNIVYPNFKDYFDDAIKKWAKAITKQWNKKELFRYDYYPFLKKFVVPNYNYAITIYKIQGRTTSNIYLIEDDVEQVSKASAKTLWQGKYVAYTRPSKQLNILNRFNDKHDYYKYISKMTPISQPEILKPLDVPTACPRNVQLPKENKLTLVKPSLQDPNNEHKGTILF